MQLHDLLETITSKTGKAFHKSGNSYSCCCPAHDDTTPSLSITEGCDGKILLYCFAGCTIERICQSLELAISELFTSPPYAQSSQKTIYSYTDEEGKEIYRKIRIEPGFDGKSKTFYSEHTNTEGSVVNNLRGCRRGKCSPPAFGAK